MKTKRRDTEESRLLVQVKTGLVILMACGPKAFKIMWVVVRL